jgi:hypothetical protein
LIPTAVVTVIFAQWHGTKVSQIWKGGHVSLGALWRLYSQYPYMPRLRDRRVLDEGIVDMPMIWATDAFALATGFDETAGRYIGRWTPDDQGAAPAATDSLILVRPDVAIKQRETEVPSPPTPDTGGTGTSVIGSGPTPKPPVDIAFPPTKTRFYGVKTLSADKIALDFKNVAEEILAHLRDAGTKLVVKIKIEATDTAGFDESKIRTVSENAQTLKFDQSGFEET